MLLQMLEHQFCDLSVFREGLSEDEDVVNVDAHGAVHNEILEDVIHHGLEGHRAVCKAEKHHKGFEQPVIGTKRGFPFVPFFYSNVVVTPLHVELGEILGSAELIN